LWSSDFLSSRNLPSISAAEGDWRRSWNPEKRQGTLYLQHVPMSTEDRPLSRALKRAACDGCHVAKSRCSRHSSSGRCEGCKRVSMTCTYSNLNAWADRWEVAGATLPIKAPPPRRGQIGTASLSRAGETAVAVAGRPASNGAFEGRRILPRANRKLAYLLWCLPTEVWSTGLTIGVLWLPS
jgi:hypothetical protein